MKIHVCMVYSYALKCFISQSLACFDYNFLSKVAFCRVNINEEFDLERGILHPAVKTKVKRTFSEDNDNYILLVCIKTHEQLPEINSTLLSVINSASHEYYILYSDRTYHLIGVSVIRLLAPEEYIYLSRLLQQYCDRQNEGVKCRYHTVGGIENPNP